MKNVLFAIVVLAIATVANAGVEVIAPASVNTGTDFQIIVGGTDVVQFVGGLYGDIDALSVEILPYTYYDSVQEKDVDSYMGGNNAKAVHLASWGGWDLTASDVNGGGIQNGNWFVMNFKAPMDEGILNFDLYDYSVSGSSPVSSYSVNVVPEPISIALLGLGGLFLRRRK